MGNVFLHMVDNNFKDLKNVFDIADDIFIVGYDADDRDHDRTPELEVQICCQEM